MSWIDKELKRRGTTSQMPPDLPVPKGQEVADRIQALWQRIEEANRALPDALRLLPAAPGLQHPGGPPVQTWLRAPNGAGLGFAGEAVRYLWPQPGRRRSHNFWLRWDVARQRYVVHQRTGTMMVPRVDEAPFDERKLEHMFKCLVTGRRITVGSIRLRRFWLF